MDVCRWEYVRPKFGLASEQDRSMLFDDVRRKRCCINPTRGYDKNGCLWSQVLDAFFMENNVFHFCFVGHCGQWKKRSLTRDFFHILLFGTNPSATEWAQWAPVAFDLCHTWPHPIRARKGSNKHSRKRGSARTRTLRSSWNRTVTKL